VLELGRGRRRRHHVDGAAGNALRVLKRQSYHILLTTFGCARRNNEYGCMQL
jgi:hypothetical protein